MGAAGPRPPRRASALCRPSRRRRRRARWVESLVERLLFGAGRRRNNADDGDALTLGAVAAPRRLRRRQGDAIGKGFIGDTSALLAGDINDEAGVDEVGRRSSRYAAASIYARAGYAGAAAASAAAAEKPGGEAEAAAADGADAAVAAVRDGVPRRHVRRRAGRRRRRRAWRRRRGRWRRRRRTAAPSPSQRRARRSSSSAGRRCGAVAASRRELTRTPSDRHRGAPRPVGSGLRPFEVVPQGAHAEHGRGAPLRPRVASALRRRKAPEGSQGLQPRRREAACGARFATSSSLGRAPTSNTLPSASSSPTLRPPPRAATSCYRTRRSSEMPPPPPSSSPAPPSSTSPPPPAAPPPRRHYRQLLCWATSSFHTPRLLALLVLRNLDPDSLVTEPEEKDDKGKVAKGPSKPLDPKDLGPVLAAAPDVLKAIKKFCDAHPTTAAAVAATVHLLEPRRTDRSPLSARARGAAVAAGGGGGESAPPSALELAAAAGQTSWRRRRVLTRRRRSRGAGSSPRCDGGW